MSTALRLQPLNPDEKDDLANVESGAIKKLIEKRSNKCCDCCGMTKKLGIRDKWFVQDPCGIVCVVITYLLMLYGEFAVMKVILLPIGFGLYSTSHMLMFNFFTIMAFLSHIRAMMTDPGAVPLGNATREKLNDLGLKIGQVVYRCPKCICIKPERAHHCSICRRCIRKMDHHCPWVNNCVGENNQKYFALFTLYIALMSMHAIVLAVTHFVLCVKTSWAVQSCSSISPASTTVFLIILGFEALLFGIFTIIMFSTQLHAICTDETGIEQLKREKAKWEKKTRCMGMKSVFGSPMSIQWLNPLSTPRVHNGKEEIYMYNV
ncbi:palmitoyltransferase ZDHHC3-like [Anneissia japonica]|uniref:palmitoyltransferase ZDHHC3-like n=1 Tax=Anneissia japonica TaxID=1529436 RepID=UPI0014258709|nr:palmitoyltransferase ZDHHC3-like [Anneissia japonica]